MLTRMSSKAGWLAAAVLTFNLLGALQAQANIYRFDMDTGAFHTQPGYTGVQAITVYSSSLGYGWDDSAGLLATDQARGPALLPLLYEDFIKGGKTISRTFLVDLANGDYRVTVFFYSTNPKDNMQVLAGGDVKLADVDLPVKTALSRTFTTTVTDGQLYLTFRKNPNDRGSSDFWIINGVEISSVPQPPTLLLLGSGLLGLGLMRRRRRLKK